MERVENVPRRLRTGVVALQIGVGNEVLGDIIDVRNDPLLFPSINTNAGWLAFNALSKYRLERIGCYFKPANLEPGYVQLTASSETSELIPLSQGIPEVALHWVMPAGWDGRLVLTPREWVITAASQLLMYVFAQWVEEPSDALAAARCGIGLEMPVLRDPSTR